MKKRNFGEGSIFQSRVSLAEFDNKSLVGSLISEELDPNEEKTIQLNFKKQIFLEIEKVGFFFSHNLNFYKARIKKIKVKKKLNNLK